MLISYRWLRELVDLPEQFTAEQVAHALTMSGLEVESLAPTQDAASDVILEVKVTPNRPDALSHMGIARELSAICQTRTRFSLPNCKEKSGPVHDAVHVSIAAKDACPRYACRVIENVKRHESPAFVKERLLACGLRPVHAIVDVTNYVMIERGHPLHAFDFDLVAKERGRANIDIRFAKKGEKITTLDGQKRVLSAEDLVIADVQGPIALAGLMGGARSQISETTTSVLLESAYFDPRVIRRMCRHHGVRTESSFRFERGCDPNGVMQALDRAAEMIAEITQGEIRRDSIDVYPKRIEPISVSLRKERLAEISGLSEKDLQEADIRSRFLLLGIETVSKRGDALCFRIPTYRPDLVREIDLIEEAMRLIGYDRVPERLSFVKRAAPDLIDHRLEQVKDKSRASLAASGFFECYNFSFGSPSDYESFVSESKSPILVQNPLGEELSAMRTSLLPGLLHNVALNQNQGASDIRLFEIGTVFLGENPSGRQPNAKGIFGPANQDAFAVEECYLSMVMGGTVGALAFDRKTQAADFFDLKGALHELLLAIGVPMQSVSFSRCKAPPAYVHPGAAAELVCHAKNGSAQAIAIGTLGALHPDLKKQYKLEQDFFVAELNLRRLAEAVEDRKLFVALPKFPGVQRDLALLLDEAIDAKEVFAAIREEPKLAPILEDVRLFDVYRGKGVPDNKKSLAISLKLRAEDHTLTDEEVNVAYTALIDRLQNQLQATLR